MSLAGPPRVAFIYGAREVLWPGIAPYLFAEKGAIRDTLIRCERLIRDRLGWSLEKACAAPRYPSEDIIDPSLTALQLALTEGWRERGVAPEAIAARCAGAFAAEYARGTLTLEDAIEVSCRLSWLTRSGFGAGRMLHVQLGVSQAQRLAAGCPAPFFVAADIAGDATVISCATGDVAVIREFLAARHIGHHLLPFSIAPHSPLVEDWKSVLLEPLKGATSDASVVAYYSAAAQGRDHGTSYRERLWAAVREPALVGRMLQCLIADGCNVFLEIGGQPSLGVRIERYAAAAGKKVVALPTMRPGQHPRATMAQAQEALRRVFSSANSGAAS